LGKISQEALQQITETVFPMYKVRIPGRSSSSSSSSPPAHNDCSQAFIEPDLKFADLKIINTFNPFSGLLNPIYTLKSDKEARVVLLLLHAAMEADLDSSR
jgi:hypothetical protein